MLDQDEWLMQYIDVCVAAYEFGRYESKNPQMDASDTRYWLWLTTDQDIKL